jgi:hypothetical protein
LIPDTLKAGSFDMEDNIKSKIPTRVLVDVSRTSPYWSQAWTSSESVISVALEVLKENCFIDQDYQPDDGSENREAAIPRDCRFLAKDRWDTHTYLVFDLFHDSYDPVYAHLPDQNALPVIKVSLRRIKRTAVTAGKIIENKVNSDLQNLHNWTGIGSQPPFSVDHADGRSPIYPSPRVTRAN